MNYDYYDYYDASSIDMNGLAGFLDILMGIYIAMSIISAIIGILQIIGMWKTFTKAGKPGWAAIVPIYNLIILLQIVKMEWWHLLIMLFVPFAIVVYLFIISIRLAKEFGKTTGFGVLTGFFPYIGYMILGFGQAQYQGVNNQFYTNAPNNQEFTFDLNNNYPSNEANQMTTSSVYSEEQSQNNDFFNNTQSSSEVNNAFFNNNVTSESIKEENNDIYKDSPSKTTYQTDPNIIASMSKEDQTQDLQEENIEQYQPNSISNQNIQSQEFNQNNQQESNQNGQF